MPEAEFENTLNHIRKFNIHTVEKIQFPLNRIDYNLYQLAKRLADAHATYLILMEAERYMDSMLSAGHILETCAIISYLKEDKDGDLHHLEKYLASDAVRTLLDLFDFVEKDNDFNDTIRDTVNEILPILQSDGEFIKNNDKDINDKDILELIQSSTKSITKKKHALRDVYKITSVNEYIENFAKKLHEFIKKANNPTINRTEQQVLLFYSAYCKVKHSGASMYAPITTESTCQFNDIHYKDMSAGFVSLCLDALVDLYKSK